MSIDIAAPGADEAALKAALLELGMPVLIDRLSAPAGGVLQFSGLDFSDYSMIEFVLAGITVDTDGVSLQVQFETGGAFLTTSYRYNSQVYSDNGTAAATTSAQSATSIALTLGSSTNEKIGSAAGEGAAGRLSMGHPSSTALRKVITGLMTFVGPFEPIAYRGMINGSHDSSVGAITGFKFFASSGNLLSGSVSILGLK